MQYKNALDYGNEDGRIYAAKVHWLISGYGYNLNSGLIMTLSKISDCESK